MVVVQGRLKINLVNTRLHRKRWLFFHVPHLRVPLCTMLLHHPSPEQQVLIRKAINEDLKTRDRDVEAIKEWLKKQPHLPDTLDEIQLMNFLRGCKFSMEKTKRKLDMYFTMRGAVPELFTNRDVRRPEIQEIIGLLQAAPMPLVTPEGVRVIAARATTADFDSFDFLTMIKIMSMMGDIRLNTEEVGVSGMVYVLDASIFPIKQFIKIPPTTIRKYLVCMQKAYPVKISGVHIINPTPVIDFVIKVVTPFLKKKIVERIRVHKDLESLFDYIPKGVLPEEFGGAAGKLQKQMDEWVKAMEEYGPWFKEQESVKADEARRAGKRICYEELFGMEGSFRQLTID